MLELQIKHCNRDTQHLSINKIGIFK